MAVLNYRDKKENRCFCRWWNVRRKFVLWHSNKYLSDRQFYSFTVRRTSNLIYCFRMSEKGTFWHWWRREKMFLLFFWISKLVEFFTSYSAWTNSYLAWNTDGKRCRNELRILSTNILCGLKKCDFLAVDFTRKLTQGSKHAFGIDPCVVYRQTRGKQKLCFVLAR